LTGPPRALKGQAIQRSTFNNRSLPSVANEIFLIFSYQEVGRTVTSTLTVVYETSGADVLDPSFITTNQTPVLHNVQENLPFRSFSPPSLLWCHSNCNISGREREVQRIKTPASSAATYVDVCTHVQQVLHNSNISQPAHRT
jgi:hypothetical protein